MKISSIFQIFTNKVVNKKTVNSTAEIKKDSVDISNEAKIRAEVEKYKSIIKNTPDVRKEKIDQVKERLQSEYYNSKKVYEDIASKFSDFINEE